ncbi:MAG TPA: flagellar filament capping protein FliD [Bryobacteraceae bacterium]|nr:flagellar filament capping protein FliD [Bryobacteraceae bacterium]
MSTSPLVFTGISTYSSDFQTILQRQQQIDQLPIKALQNKQTDNINKKQALVALDPIVGNLGSAVAALGSIAANQGLVATSSDSSTVSIVNTSATSPTNFTISNIQTLATAASETSLKGYADSTTVPVSVAGQNKVDLVVGSNTYHLDLTGKNNLTGLRDAINNAGAGVNASILTTGSGNYLTISSNSLGATTLALNDVPAATSTITNTGTGTETSLTGYPDTNSTAVSPTGKVDFTIGSSTYHLNIAGSNNLTGLMNAINGSGAAVTASITNSGGSNYLQIVANGGPATMTLTNVATNLISQTNQGTNADFMLNGTIHITRASNVISDVVPGVSFTLKNTTAGTVNLSLASDSTQLSNALQTFVTNYNAVVDQIQQQVGSSAGSLGGDALIRTISEDMRALTGYGVKGGTTVSSLYDIGITFEDTSGHLTFNAGRFASLSSAQISDAFKFFGSSTTGFGQLASNFTQLTDPITGVMRLQEDGFDTENNQLNDQINVLNTRAKQMEAGMSARLQQADALAAELQSQQTSLNAAIQSINYVTYGKVVSATGQ